MTLCLGSKPAEIIISITPRSLVWSCREELGKMKENVSSHNMLKWPAAWISKLFLTYCIHMNFRYSRLGRVNFPKTGYEVRTLPSLHNNKTDKVVFFFFPSNAKKTQVDYTGSFRYDPPEKFIQPQRSLLIILFSTPSFLTDATLIQGKSLKSLTI